jgi:hypothetical protein
LNVQKQERFAEAFRNAFRIGTSKRSAALPLQNSFCQTGGTVSSESEQARLAMENEVAELRAANTNLQHSVFQLIDQMCKASSGSESEPRLAPTMARKSVDLEFVVDSQQRELDALRQDNNELRIQLHESRELQQQLMSEVWILQRQRDRSSSPRVEPSTSRGSSTWTAAGSTAAPVPRLALHHGR